MRIRNKILLAMSVPIGLLVVQVIAVNHFVRELQSAASFIASAHEAIEADFDALDLVGKLRQEVRKLPSGAVAGQATSLDSRSTRQELWDRLDRAVGAVTSASAAREVDPQQFQALRAALDQARKDYARSEELATLAKGDINSLIQGAIYADRALLALEGALNSMTVELRRELQEAVDHERSIHDRPVIAGIVIGGSAVLFLLAFAWLYADRHLAGRLLALSRSMLAIAAGNLRTPLPDSNGKDEIAAMAKALSIFRDTAVEIEEQSLRERQVVLDTIDYGVLILDPNLRVRMFNRAFRDLWSVPRDVLRPHVGIEDLLGALRSTGLHGVTDEQWPSYIERRLNEIQAADVPPREWHRPDGRVLQYEVVALPDGGRMLTYFDLTDLKQVESELRAAKELAETASRAKSDFLASMSHELRTPLNAIIGITEMLKEDAEVDGDKHLDEPLGRVLRAGKLLLQLINEVLDLAKIEAGKLELQPENIDLGPLLDDVVDTAKPLAEKHANQLRLDVQMDLGRAVLDPMRLRQVLLNLLSNACKFTENGEVTLFARREGQQVELRVRDTGMGIDADQLPRLFQEFHQAGAAKHRKYGGTGLGLAISRRLVTLMGGEIEATSEKGKGSEFTIRLPVDAPVQAEAA
jgi:signal transduction histidine kinase